MENDLISRSALLTKATNVTKYDEGGWDMVLRAVPVDAVENAPAVDAVEVVFCDNCTSHNNCVAEGAYRLARIEKPFCCAGNGGLTMPAKLKPCPKCGREPASFRITFNLFDGEPVIRFRYSCHRCGISGKVCGDLADAAEAWNGKDAAANGILETAVRMRKEVEWR